MKILHITDIHYRKKYPKNTNNYKQFLPNMNPPKRFLETVAKLINEEEIDFLINSGDLTDDGDLDDYLELKLLLNRNFGHLDHVHCLGNHDNHQLFFDAFNYPKKKHQEKYFNQVWDFEDLRVVVFDNTFEKTADGQFVNQQIQWLDHIMNESKSKKVLLVMHHHIMSSKHQVPPVKRNRSFENIVKSSSIVGIICGHTHHAYQGMYLNKPFSIGPSLSFRGVLNKDFNYVIFEENPGFQIIEIINNDIRFKPIYLLDDPIFLGKMNV